jgi:formate dehydrogenase assembly factor FdhD
MNLNISINMCTDVAAGAAAVVGNELLARRPGQDVGRHAAHDVSGSAWRERDDEAHGLGGILRLSGRADRKSRDDGGNKKALQ